MLEHIKAAEEKLAANLDPRPHIVAALHAVAQRIEAIGETADGAVAEHVKAIDERLTSLTSAVSSIGADVRSQSAHIDESDAKMGALGGRVATLEAKAAAPAVPPAPPQA
jgi:hypothetical protein